MYIYTYIIHDKQREKEKGREGGREGGERERERERDTQTDSQAACVASGEAKFGPWALFGLHIRINYKGPLRLLSSSAFKSTSSCKASWRLGTPAQYDEPRHEAWKLGVQQPAPSCPKLSLKQYIATYAVLWPSRGSPLRFT